MAIIVPIVSTTPTAAMPSTTPLPNAAATSASAALLPQRSTSIKILDRPGTTTTTTTTKTSRPVPRRDSLEKRDSLLHGAAGSRQRRRWENAHLLSNPWAEPPLPSDWEVRPTYPTRVVPYYLAPLWDAAEFQRSVEAKLAHRRNGSGAGKGGGKMRKKMTKEEEAASNVPKEVRAKLKRARAAKGLLRELEEEVRAFVVGWREREVLRLREQGAGLEESLVLPSDSEMEDDEIVFVGRNGAMHDSGAAATSPGGGSKERELEDEDGESMIEKDKLVFEGLLDDKGASFGRWLVHEIAAYYSLKSWSETVDGEPKVRQAFVGHHGLGVGPGGRFAEGMELPKPLYAMV